jgi:L-ascorbate metabolism protein UlaG (beta-lactamase superfamily)
MIKKWLFVLLLILFSGGLFAHSNGGTSIAQYLANEGLMVTHGDTKVVFDPLFRNSYGHYQLLPKDVEEALFAGTPPFDGIDAVFISHYHGDHFSPEDVLRLLKVQPQIRLYAPVQAVEGLRQVATVDDQQVFERVTAVELAYKDAPVHFEMDGLKIGAVRIPHSGWPTGRLDVENISWRVTLDETTTVLHMGDADPNGVHFERDSAYWDQRVTDMAFPPYWFFDSTYGPDVLENLIRAKKNVGIHVPVTIATNPAARSAGLKDKDLFTKPGETRVIED